MHPETHQGDEYTKYHSSEGGMRVGECLAWRRLSCLQMPTGLPEGEKDEMHVVFLLKAVFRLIGGNNREADFCLYSWSIFLIT